MSRHVYAPVAVGDIVKKTGRTTNFTTGSGDLGQRHRQRQLRLRTSGEVRQPDHHDLDERRRRLGQRGARLANNAIGLLFAGSSAVTIINNIQFVQALLEVRLAED